MEINKCRDAGDLRLVEKAVERKSADASSQDRKRRRTTDFVEVNDAGTA